MTNHSNKPYTYFDSLIKHNQIKQLPKRCECCGSNKQLTLHHVVPIGVGGNPLDISNVARVCLKCHQKIHKIPRKSKNNSNFNVVKRFNRMKNLYKQKKGQYNGNIKRV
jgi:hypothetical protein